MPQTPLIKRIQIPRKLSGMRPWGVSTPQKMTTMRLNRVATGTDTDGRLSDITLQRGKELFIWRWQWWTGDRKDFRLVEF